MCPVITATTAAMTGIASQLAIPQTRLTTARVFVRRTAAATGGGALTGQVYAAKPGYGPGSHRKCTRTSSSFQVLQSLFDRSTQTFIRRAEFVATMSGGSR